MDGSMDKKADPLVESRLFRFSTHITKDLFHMFRKHFLIRLREDVSFRNGSSMQKEDTQKAINRKFAKFLAQWSLQNTK